MGPLKLFSVWELIFVAWSALSSASPLRLDQTNGDQLQALLLSTNNPPAIDPAFSTSTILGSDRVKGLPTYLTAVEAVRELALNDAFGREEERDFQYATSQDVKFHVRGWPSRSIPRRYVLWGIVSCVGVFTQRRYVTSVACTLLMGQRKVGVLTISGPNTPTNILESVEGTFEPISHQRQRLQTKPRM